MNERLKATAPLAISVGILTFLWVEAGANFTFHWFTSGDLGNGLALPNSFHAVIPAAFVAWGLFFSAGADRAAFRKVAIASGIGALAALILMFALDHTGDVPDFWVLSLITAVLAVLVVLASAVGDWYFVPGIFGAFGSTLFWWIATGMDGWSPGGGGTNTLAALGDAATAGTGAFGGVLSTPYVWVFVNTLASLLIGCLLGVASVRLSAIITPRTRQDLTV